MCGLKYNPTFSKNQDQLDKALFWLLWTLQNEPVYYLKGVLSSNFRNLLPCTFYYFLLLLISTHEEIKRYFVKLFSNSLWEHVRPQLQKFVSLETLFQTRCRLSGSSHNPGLAVLPVLHILLSSVVAPWHHGMSYKSIWKSWNWFHYQILNDL